MTIFMDIFIENMIETFIAFCCGKNILHTRTRTQMVTKVVEVAAAAAQWWPYIYGHAYGIFARFHFDYFWHYLFDALKVVTLRMLIFQQQ